MGITIKDVAKTANVSVATVSRVLNKKDNVSNEAIEAVNEAVERLGYSPNFLGRDLRKSETKRILAIIPSFEHSFYSDVLRGMSRAAMEKGYDVLTASMHDKEEHEMHLLGMLFSRSVDGVVILGPKLDAAKLSKLSENYNIAMCIERLDGCTALTVTIDNVKAARDATEYLIAKGRKRIGLVTTWVRSQSSIDREEGYKKALQDHGIEVREEYIYYGTYDYESGILGCNGLLDLPEPPDAVFAVSDNLAMGVINAAMRRGFKVGKDILVFGFDNISFSSIFSPHISTVAQPAYEQGKLIVEKLVENMKSTGERDNGTYMLPHSLVLRESTGD